MNLRSVDLNLLVAFDTLISERNVSRAANRLNMTQSALSHALRRLRVTFGDPLLRRGRRGMEPTDRALSLHPAVRNVLGDIHSILSSKISFEPATARRTFKLSMSDAMSIEALPLIVRRLRKEAPNVDLLVTSCGPRDASARIISDDVEMGIGVFPHLPRELLERELYRDSLVCVADRNNPLLKRGRMDEKSYFASLTSPLHPTLILVSS
jgi:DNA-binding transcriptional LysR family regulator